MVSNAARILATPHVRAVGFHHQTVVSSNIASWEYRASTLELVVTFSGGEVYRYRGVSRQTWQALAKADSKGEAFARLIVDKYRFSKAK